MPMSRRSWAWSCPSTSNSSTRRRQKSVAQYARRSQTGGWLELGDGALGMEVGDAVDELSAQHHVGRRDPVQEHGRTAREQDGLGRRYHRPGRAQQPGVGLQCPKQPLASARLAVGLRVELVDAEAPASDAFGFMHRTGAGQPDQRHVLALLGQLGGEHQAVLADRSEVGRQPVADVYEIGSLHGGQGFRLPSPQAISMSRTSCTCSRITRRPPAITPLYSGQTKNKPLCMTSWRWRRLCASASR